MKRIIMIACSMVILAQFNSKFCSADDTRANHDSMMKKHARSLLSTGQEGKELSNLIARADRSFSRMKVQIPASVLSKANCIAIFPEVTEGALVVGGKHGDGVATCRLSDDSWSKIGFVDITGASLGAQIGMKKTDLALLFTTDKARQALVDGKLSLGAEIGVTAGSTDKTISAQTSMKDIVSYSTADGAFIGAQLDGTSISADQDSLEAFYHQPMSLRSLLSSENESKNSAVDSFLKNL